MKIIVDCMGGDNAPREMLLGVSAAKEEYGGEYLLVGKVEEMRSSAENLGISLDGFEILGADDVITMEDDPVSAIRNKTEASMTKGLRALADGYGDAFVSCGNTGALFTGATLITKRIKGVKRAAIATVLPFDPPVLLLDAGANVTVTPDHLLQFAVMGSAYSSKLFGTEHARVGLLNNGSEESKGTPERIEAYKIFKKASDDGVINFVGNIESNDIAFNVCDVLVTDGFTGNILLKTVEGLGKLVMGRMKDMFCATPITKMAAVAVKKSLTKFKHDFDATEYGGSPILGVSKVVIKAHGSSNAKAFKNAIRQARECVSTEVVSDICLTMTEDALIAKNNCGEDC